MTYLPLAGDVLTISSNVDPLGSGLDWRGAKLLTRTYIRNLPRSTGRSNLLVRAENRVHDSDQQSCSPSRPAVMITSHVPAVRFPS
jgi:hypothetical protein